MKRNRASLKLALYTSSLALPLLAQGTFEGPTIFVDHIYVDNKVDVIGTETSESKTVI